ncbi:4'-phosphopantetheinyl transferase family protein [Pseudoxanthomonas wuyuanensis]
MSSVAMMFNPIGESGACTGLRAAFEEALPWSDASRLSRGHALVGLFELDDWRGWLPQAAALLDGPERARVQRRRRPVDRETLTLAYALHRLFLQAALSLDAAILPLGRDALGCPRLEGGAAHTSLSHSEAHVAIAVCRHGPVGVDVEPCLRRRVMDEIAAQICHPDEAAEMAAFSEEARTDALLGLWVRKEALLKAAGIGLARSMDSFRAPAGQALPLGPELELELAGKTCLHMLEDMPGVMAAVAAPVDVPVLSGWFRPRAITDPATARQLAG